MLFRSVFVKWNFDTTEKISPGIAGLPAVLRGKLFFSYFLAAGLVTAGSHGIPGEIFFRNFEKFRSFQSERPAMASQ